MRTLLLALGLFLSPLSAWAAVALDACTNAEPASCTNCDTAAHTVAAGANYLVVFAGGDDNLAGTNFTGASWDQTGTPQAMTALADNGGVGNIYGRVFGLANPTVGNKTLRVTATSSNGTADIMICSFSGVDTSNPVTLANIAETESTATVAGDSLAFTLGSNGLAVAYLFTATTWPNYAKGANETARVRNSTSCNGDCDGTLTTGTVSPFAPTWDSTSRNFWHVIIPLNASGGRKPSYPMVLK
jgi:hypothetical protein